MSSASSSWNGQEFRLHISIDMPPSSDPNEPPFGWLGQGVALTRNHAIVVATKTILVYSLLSGRLIHSLKGHTSVVERLAVYRDTLVSASHNSPIRVWDLASGRCLRTLSFGGAYFLSIVKPELVEVEQKHTLVKERWPKDPLVVASIFDGDTFRVWKLEYSGRDGSKANLDGISKDMRNLDAYDDHRVHCLAARGRFVLTGSYNCTVCIWDVIMGQRKWILIGHTNRVVSVDLDEGQAYSGSQDSTIRIWNVHTGDCSYILKLTSPILEARLSHSYLVSLHHDGTLCVHNLIDHKLHYRLTSVADWLRHFLHDDYKLCFQSNGSLKLWDMRNNRLIMEYSLGNADAYDIQFTDSFLVAYLRQDSKMTIKVWRFADEKPDGSSNENGI
ncbi:WD40-repeat-containing domain protein [Gymnopilus junonius]|uniref:WD40-repeat-containing domain protein n=1 Tax=Gymnopilus junonius TaxID=109634 RepID=A0A9P5TN59_GYMJU|nr:WD40-repeat-containing domain protein [Gymnopilus junonius]